MSKERPNEDALYDLGEMLRDVVSQARFTRGSEGALADALAAVLDMCAPGTIVHEDARRFEHPHKMIERTLQRLHGQPATRLREAFKERRSK